MRDLARRPDGSGSSSGTMDDATAARSSRIATSGAAADRCLAKDSARSDNVATCGDAARCPVEDSTRADDEAGGPLETRGGLSSSSFSSASFVGRSASSENDISISILSDADTPGGSVR